MTERGEVPVGLLSQNRIRQSRVLVVIRLGINSTSKVEMPSQRSIGAIDPPAIRKYMG